MFWQISISLTRMRFYILIQLKKTTYFLKFSFILRIQTNLFKFIYFLDNFLKVFGTTIELQLKKLNWGLFDHRLLTWILSFSSKQQFKINSLNYKLSVQLMRIVQNSSLSYQLSSGAFTGQGGQKVLLSNKLLSYVRE